jgi:hypothetical protein
MHAGSSCGEIGTAGFWSRLDQTSTNLAAMARGLVPPIYLWMKMQLPGVTGDVIADRGYARLRP